MTQARVELLADSRQVRRATDDLRQLENRGQATTNVVGGLARAFVALGAAAVIGKAINTTRNFNQAIADLSAITGAAGRDLQFYREQAAEIGRTTSLSASQAAEAFKLIASAKPDLLSSADALAAVTKEAVTLAEASGILLPDAASALGSALNQFQLDASRANEVINILAAGSKLGAAEVPAVTEALRNAGSAANSLGIDLAETVAGIQALATAGRQGADAGTALRQVMLRLERTGDSALQPSIVGLTSAINELASRNLSTTELMKLFGDEAFSAATALLSQRDTLAELNVTLRDTDTATEQARKRMDTLTGDIKAFNSALEGLTIAVLGDEFDGLARSATQLGTDAINGLTENLDTLADVGIFVAGIFGARLAGSIGTSTLAFIQHTVAQQTVIARYAQINGISAITATRMAAVGLAARGANAALALVGGPIGVAVLAAAGLLAFAERSETAEDRAKRLAGEVDNLAGSLEGLSRAEIIEREQAALQNVFETQQRINELVERRANAELNIADPSRVTSDQREYNQVIGNSRAAIERYNLEIEALRKKQEEERGVVNEVTEARKALVAQLEENKRKAEELNAAQDSKKLQEITQALDDQIYALENGEIAYEVMRAAREANIALDSPEADGIRARISERERLTQAIKDETQAERERKQLREGVTGIVNTLSVGDDPAAQAEDEMFARLSVIDNALAAEAITKEEHRQAELLAEQAYQDELTKINNEEAKARAEAQKQANEMARQSQQATLSATENLFGNLAEIAKQGGEESFGAYKALASAQAGISAALAILQVYGDPTIPTFLKFPLSATIGAITAAQIAQINSQQYTGARALGGQVQAGGQYLVGERGPELITMGSNGNVTPYNQLMREARTTNNDTRNMTANISFTLPEGNADFRNRIADNRDLIYNVVADVLNDRGQRF